MRILKGFLHHRLGDKHPQPNETKVSRSGAKEKLGVYRGFDYLRWVVLLLLEAADDASLLNVTGKVSADDMLLLLVLGLASFPLAGHLKRLGRLLLHCFRFIEQRQLVEFLNICVKQNETKYSNPELTNASWNNSRGLR